MFDEYLKALETLERQDKALTKMTEVVRNLLGVMSAGNKELLKQALDEINEGGKHTKAAAMVLCRAVLHPRGDLFPQRLGELKARGYDKRSEGDLVGSLGRFYKGFFPVDFDTSEPGFLYATFMLGKSIRSSAWQDCAKYLGACDFEDEKRKKMRNSYRKLYHSGIEEDLNLCCANHPALQRLLYFLYGPGPAKPANQKLRCIESQPGTQYKVGSGTVQALLYAKLFSDITNTIVAKFDKESFGFIYTGPDAKHAHWIQFIWREEWEHPPGEDAVAVSGKIETTGGKYRLTHDVKKRHFNLDVTTTAQTPFYEDAGGFIRRPDSIAMFDCPSAGGASTSYDTIQQLKLKDPGHSTESIAHFDTFLVIEQRVVFHFEIRVRRKLTRPVDKALRLQMVKGLEATYSYEYEQVLIVEATVLGLPDEYHHAFTKKAKPKYRYLKLLGEPKITW